MEKARVRRGAGKTDVGLSGSARCSRQAVDAHEGWRRPTGRPSSRRVEYLSVSEGRVGRDSVGAQR
eukprot:scaffold273990_cov28-Tisochrysis_lutea.AAC.2